MRFVLSAFTFVAISFSSQAFAFNDLSCASQAKLLAESIVLSQVGNSYSRYQVQQASENKSRYDVTIVYEARIPSNNDAASFRIEFKFSDFSEGNTEEVTQKQCYINDIKILMAG